MGSGKKHFRGKIAAGASEDECSESDGSPAKRRHVDDADSPAISEADRDEQSAFDVKPAPISLAVSNASQQPGADLWFHRLGPNLERDRERAAVIERPTTTPLDLSKLGHDDRKREVPLPTLVAKHLIKPANLQMLVGASGTMAEWNENEGKMVLRGSADQLKVGTRLLLRVAMHCQWGASDDKVQRLLSCRRAESVLVRLAPMGLNLHSVERALNRKANTLSIGKDKSNDVVLPDVLVSRHHCVLELDSGRGAVYVLDCSTNGTFLNGKRLPQKKRGKVLLSHGDELLLKDPQQDAEFGYMVNLVDGMAPTLQHKDDEAADCNGRG